MENMSRMLHQARERKSAVGAFNAYNYETVKGILAAARAFKAPVIVAFGEKYLANMSLSDIYAVTDSLSRQHPFPVCLHLDHCSSLPVIEAAIGAGFSSVMFDGSALSYEKNLRITREVCKMAHAHGITVEAELGSLAAGNESHEGSEEDRETYTDPQQAHEFSESTGCDALAVSIGTVHGLYRKAPQIRLDILEAIAKQVAVPLVLHGGSDTPDSLIRACIERGITKINVNTEISGSVIEKTAELLRTEKPHLAVLSLRQQEFVSEAVSRALSLFWGKS